VIRQFFMRCTITRARTCDYRIKKIDTDGSHTNGS